ncbi:hypothetical protein [Bradyrhizobium sp. DASA03007]|uniref:hypothetical protein n=1 Tax=unclassified Bradyrhizobium TaxID=2631580 RepID=UPI003F6F641B
MSAEDPPEELTLKLLPMPGGNVRLVVWENNVVVDIHETIDGADPKSVRRIMNEMLRVIYVKGYTKDEYAVRVKG